MVEAYIYDAVRTPRGKGRAGRDGKPGGSLFEIAPHEMVSQLIDAVSARMGEDAISQVDKLILGCVGQVGSQGGHIALVSKLASRLSVGASTKTLNNYCVSGLTALNEAVLISRAGEGGLTLAGGVESLSQVPFLADKASYYTKVEMIKSLKWAPPVMGAELIATLDGIDKPSIDALTLRSHQRAAAAWEGGRYSKSVVPVTNKDGEIVLAYDELIRSDMTLETLEKFLPAFGGEEMADFDKMMLGTFPELAEISHIHSIANCPGMADGAALLLVGTKEAGEKAGLKPRARVVSVVDVGGDPVLQFSAGYEAAERALAKAGMKVEDLDLIEFMEAFAAVPLKFERDNDIDPNIINVNGGHLAMGHPMGATGAMLATGLFHELERQGKQTGLVTALAGGGIGSALVMELV